MFNFAVKSNEPEDDKQQIAEVGFWWFSLLVGNIRQQRLQFAHDIVRFTSPQTAHYLDNQCVAVDAVLGGIDGHKQLQKTALYLFIWKA